MYEISLLDLDSTLTKQKVQKHGKTVEHKFNEIHNILYIIDNTLKQFSSLRNFRPKKHEEPSFRIISTHYVRVHECKRKDSFLTVWVPF